jgi:hypothetical protein
MIESMPTVQPPSASPVASKCQFLPPAVPTCPPLKCPIEVSTNQIHTSSPIPLPPSCRLLRSRRSRRPFPVPSVLPAIRSRAAARAKAALLVLRSPWPGRRVARLPRHRHLRSRLVPPPLVFPAIGAAAAPNAKNRPPCSLPTSTFASRHLIPVSSSRSILLSAGPWRGCTAAQHAWGQWNALGKAAQLRACHDV